MNFGSHTDDLRDLLKRKFGSNNSATPNDADIRTKFDSAKIRRVSTNDSGSERRAHHSIDDLCDKLKAKTEDLRVELNRSKRTDLRRQLERSKSKDNLAPPDCDNRSAPEDLRAMLLARRAEIRPQINFIMGHSPPCGNSVRSVKDYRRQADTSQRWPLKPPNDHPITFFADDAIGVHIPHNDPLLVVLGIRAYDVTKCSHLWTSSPVTIRS